MRNFVVVSNGGCHNLFSLEWTLHVLVSKQSLTVLFLTLLFNLVGGGAQDKWK